MRTIADKQISDLVAANSIQTTDLFVLEQDRTAKKLTGQILVNYLTSIADGHGGIAGITWETSGTSGDGQLHTATIHYADATTSTFSIRDGLKGDKGDTWYFYIKYSADLPTSDADMSNTPDNYIGVYYGTASTAPTHYTAYTWYKWKGEKGDTGDPCLIQSQSVTYLASASGTVVPEGSWQSNIPSVTPGYFLWTRTRVTYNDGTVTTAYAVSRNGIDGSGAVSSVNEVSPDPNGNISLMASNIPTTDSTSVQQHIADIESDVSDLATYEVRHVTGNLTSLPASFSYSWITANHRVINCVFGNPSALTSNVTWTTTAGDITFSGTMANLATTTIDFDIVKVAT